MMGEGEIGNLRSRGSKTNNRSRRNRMKHSGRWSD